MKGFKTFLILAIVVAVAYGIFQEEESATGEHAPATARSVASAGHDQPLFPAYATLPLRNDWPALPKSEAGEERGGMAEDLLAANYYVVVDGSGSMRSTDCSDGRPKMEAAVEALIDFAARLPANANLGMLAFDHHGVAERLPLGSGNREAFNQAVQEIVANRGTPLRSSMEHAYTQLEGQARRQLGYGEYHLVVVTDGIASSGEDPTGIVGQILSESPVLVHTIGFCIGTRHSLNQPGRTLYWAAENPEELAYGLRQVLAEAPAFSLDAFDE